MEVVALNEQLREEFAGVVKHFLTIRREEIARVAGATGGAMVFAAAVVPVAQASHVDDSQPDAEPEPLAAAPAASATRPQQQQLTPGLLLPERTQQYAALAKTILRRVNMYQYKSREAFGRDIAELLLLADASDQKLLLQQLVDQQRALAASSSAGKPSGGRAKRQKVNGIRIDSASIPGIQCRTDTIWACNVDMRGNTSTMSVHDSREKAEESYRREVRDALHEMPHGESELDGMASELAAACSNFDSAILRDAMRQVKQRLPIARHHDVSSLTAALAPHAPPQLAAHSSKSDHTTTAAAPKEKTAAAPKEKEPKASRKRELVIDTTVPTVAATSTTHGKPITPAAATPELVAKRTPTDHQSRMQFLRLRRLIQMRLCRHLEGREICTRMNEPGHVESWEATGRLERGKVYAYSTKKLVNFSDFVLAKLKRSVAACAHIYLLDTRESIDAHLLVCDQFSDEFRQRLDQNFQEASEQYKQGKMN